MTADLIAHLRGLLAASDDFAPRPWRAIDNGFDAGIYDGTGTGKVDGCRIDARMVFGGEPHEGRIEPDDPCALLTVAAVNHLALLLDVAEAAEEFDHDVFQGHYSGPDQDHPEHVVIRQKRRHDLRNAVKRLREAKP